MEGLARTIQFELSLRLLIAFIGGAVIGIEREHRSKAAGLRTHMLVAGGSAIFTVASMTLFSGDTGRIAAQIVTGVGFLGAGAILRPGSSVTGLTTAATVWVAAGVGMLAGGGAYWLAFISAVLTVGALRVPHKWLRRHKHHEPDPDELEDS